MVTQESASGSKSLIKKIFLGILYFALTIVFIFILIYILSETCKLNNTVSGGIPLLAVLFFWGVYFSKREGGIYILGIICFILAIFFNLIIISSPYKNSTDFLITRIFVFFGIGTGIYFILRKIKFMKIFGILVIILTILAMILGWVFNWTRN